MSDCRLCANTRMASTDGRTLYLLCFLRSIWIVYTECGYYNEIPTDVCSYKFVEYVSGESSSFSCKYDDKNNSWIILQNIYDGSKCNDNPIHQIEYECSSKDCHCSKTSSGYDCDVAIVRTEDFDFEHKKCDPRSYTESLIVVNQCINNYKKYQCQDSKLILQGIDSQGNLSRPSLLSPSRDAEYDNCVDIKCMDRFQRGEYGEAALKHKNQQKIDSKQACIPVNVCQNSYDKLQGNTSWKYNCDEHEIINKFVYNEHDCVGYQLYDIFDTEMFEYQRDIISCNECRNYLKIREYDVNDIDGCDEGKKNEYNYDEVIFSLGCHSFWIDDGIKHSIKRTCTNESYFVEKYDNGHCGGLAYGEYQVNEGCDFVDIKLHNDSFSYLSLIEIMECGLIKNNNADSLNKVNEIFFLSVIFFVLFIC